MVIFDEKRMCIIVADAGATSTTWVVINKSEEKLIHTSGINPAINKANKFQPKKIRNSIAASDAFFPFADGVKILIKSGIKVIVQPGGSIKDKEIINLANKAKIKMLFTEVRHFNH